MLAQVYEAMGNDEAKREQLAIMLEHQQHDFAAPLELAEHALQAGDLDQATYYVDRALAVNPYRPEIHRIGAQLASRLGDTGRTVQEYEVLLTLDQNDPVAARTDLARAYLDNRQRDEARKTVLRALETAPTYERAQQILLQAVEASEED